MVDVDRCPKDIENLSLLFSVFYMSEMEGYTSRMEVLRTLP